MATQAEKDLHRAARAEHRARKQSEPEPVVEDNGPIDCACVIHGDVYSWKYVDTVGPMWTVFITCCAVICHAA